MDLGICPKCGNGWTAGDERCRSCGYVAIGAGLAALKPKKKKRVRKYVEPGGSAPMLSFTLVAILLTGGYYYRPWEDDWDLLRSICGQGRHHPLRGTWEVVETLQTWNSQNQMYSDQKVASGEIKFDGGSGVELDVTNTQGTVSLKGHYTVEGESITMIGLKATDPTTMKIPKVLR